MIECYITFIFSDVTSRDLKKVVSSDDQVSTVSSVAKSRLNSCVVDISVIYTKKLLKIAFMLNINILYATQYSR